MREGVLFLRELGRSAATGGGSVTRFAQRHRPTWVIAAASAAFLGGIGAFETGTAAPWALYSYWGILTFAGGAMSAWMIDRIDDQGWFGRNPFLQAAGLLLTLSTAATPLVWVMSAVALNGSWEPLRMRHLWPQVLIVGAAFLALQLFAERSLARAAAARRASASARPKLLDRLPDKLRGAALEAIEAEDHYLRLYTDRGSALVLMRLSDAVAELEGLEGSRTHRSWWVARDAVIGAARGRGRATLRLKSGLQAPVSRTYAPLLRRSGWF
jgi:hypothetical protein